MRNSGLKLPEYDKKITVAAQKQDEMKKYMCSVSAVLAKVGITLPDMPTLQSGASTTNTQKSGEKSDKSQSGSKGWDPPTSTDDIIILPPRPLGAPVDHGDGSHFDWNGGLDENIAEEALENEKEELCKFDRDQKKLEKEKARLLQLQQQEEEEGKDEYISEGDDDTKYTRSPAGTYHSNEASSQDQGYVSAEDDLDNIEASNLDEDE